jgi:hypothetical protein
VNLRFKIGVFRLEPVRSGQWPNQKGSWDSPAKIPFVPGGCGSGAGLPVNKVITWHHVASI